MIVKLYAYPTNWEGRVPLTTAQTLTGTPGEGDGWAEHTPGEGTHTDGLDMLALALRWASEGQAVRVEFN